MAKYSKIESDENEKLTNYSLVVSDIISKAEVKLDEDIKDADYILKIHGVDKLSLGNISAVIGKAKSKKTFLLSLFTAAVLGNNIDGVLQPVKPGDIIYVDTEQGRYDVQRVLKRINFLNNQESYKVRMYGLRPYTPDERLDAIDEMLKMYGNKSVMLVIDGIRDLIYDINSAVESTNIMSKIMKWSDDYNIHIVCVLHQNKADGSARGHIGTELQNKSESVLRVERELKDYSLSNVSEVFGRGKGVPGFSIKIKNTGMPIIVDAVVGLDGYNDDDIPF